MSTAAYGFDQLAAAGTQAGLDKIQRNRNAQDEERQLKATDIINTRNNNLTKLPTLPEGTAEHDEAVRQIKQSQYDLAQLYHPDKAPGALQRDWHFLLGKMHGIVSPKSTPSPQNSTPHLVTQTFEGTEVPGMTAKGSWDLSNRPNIDNGDGTHSSVFSQTVTTDNGAILLLGVGDGHTYPMRQLRNVYISPDGKQQAWFVPGKQPDGWKQAPVSEATSEAFNQYKKTGKDLGKFKDEESANAYGEILHEDQAKSNGAHPIQPGKITWGQAQLLKKQAASRQKSDAEAMQMIAGVPLSPERTAINDVNVKNAADLARIQGQIKNYKILNPNATDEDVAAYASTLLPGNNLIGNWERVDGTLNGQPYALSYDKKRGIYKYPDGTISSNMPENFKPTPKGATATAEELKEYADDSDPNKGTFPEWLAAKRVKGTNSVPKNNRDDKYIALLQKKGLGQQLTPDESAYVGAYDLWTQKTKVDPGVARAAAFGAMRYIPVVDPSDPSSGNVVMMRAGDAAKAGVSTPASIAFKTDAAMTRYMTSGAGGTNITYFNTATDHLKILAEAGEALNNGNIQLFNAYANKFATATGDPAPSNFETVKAAVAGELSKTFKGTGATDAEISDINTTINQAQSPQQIMGAINYYTRLMGSKITALRLQYEAGMQGKPNFPSVPGAPPSGGSKGTKSLKAAMAMPQNKRKTKQQVMLDLNKHGWKVKDDTGGASGPTK